LSDVLRGRFPERKELTMANRRKVKGVYLPKKTYWHLYSLQSIGSEKLAKIVNKILRREYQLIK
jgi:hypothetical protein